jgi:DNA ligase (NAD+)
VGQALADTLAGEFGSLDALAAADTERLQQAPDVGPEVAAAVTGWFANEKNRALVAKLKDHGIDPRMAKPEKVGGRLAGLTIVVTGELESMTRDEAREAVRREGGKATGSVSKGTDYLVVGASPGANKTAAAEKYGTKTLDERGFLRLLGQP